MTRIESEKVIIHQSAEEIFSWFCNLNNYQKLMPEQVTDWTSTETECSFTIKGMATLGMELSEKIPFTQVKLLRKGKAPFDFVLVCNIEKKETEISEVQLLFDADLNAFLKMMAEKPLTNFLNMLVGKYQRMADINKDT
jgi:hypothetical protein